MAIFCGNVMGEGRVCESIEPWRPLRKAHYNCGSSFVVEPLRRLTTDARRFGFAVVDGNGCLCAAVASGVETILSKRTVELPKKHRRGGQSAARFGRLRQGARHQYVVKCCEQLKAAFLGGGAKLTVQGLVLAGCGDLKHELRKCAALDPRLERAIVEVVDVAHGGNAGLRQAIAMTAERVGSTDDVRLSRVLQRYFDTIAQEAGRATVTAVYGVEVTLRVLENYPGAAATVLVEDGLERDGPDGRPLTDWLRERQKELGLEGIDYVKPNSEAGRQFCKSFQLGAVLRYPLAVSELEDEDLWGEDEWM